MHILMQTYTYLEPGCYHCVINIEDFTHLELFEDLHAHIIERSSGEGRGAEGEGGRRGKGRGGGRGREGRGRGGMVGGGVEEREGEGETLYSNLP